MICYKLELDKLAEQKIKYLLTYLFSEILINKFFIALCWYSLKVLYFGYLFIIKLYATLDR